jgi:hypothetical protein
VHKKCCDLDPNQYSWAHSLITLRGISHHYFQKPFTPLGLIALLRDIGVSDVRRRDDEHRER